MASSTQDLIPHLQLANTFGALYIGAILATVSYSFVINFANIGALTEIVWSSKVFPPINRPSMTYTVKLVNDGRSRALPIMVGVAVLTSGVATAVDWVQTHWFLPNSISP
ncbi:hypothetical protein EDB19DRAFT_2027114 [Suillus lakei]|nr:hypothetical protein EDB19DRAFT_2027114 [Suillus lakei]